MGCKNNVVSRFLGVGVMAAGKNEEEKIEKGGKIGEMASKMENASFLSYENF